MSVYVQPRNEKQKILMYLTEEGNKPVFAPTYTKEEIEEFQIDHNAVSQGNIPVDSDALSPLYLQYQQQEKLKQARLEAVASHTSVASNATESTSTLERRKAAKSEIYTALEQASLLAELTSLLRNSVGVQNANQQSSGPVTNASSHITVSTSSQTALFNDQSRILPNQNKLYLVNSFYEKAENILKNTEYLRSKLNARRQQLQYLKEISKTSRTVSYFDSKTQQERLPQKHQVTIPQVKRVSVPPKATVLFQKRFHSLHDMLAIDCSQQHLYAHPLNRLTLLPIPTSSVSTLFRSTLDSMPRYSLQLEILNVHTLQIFYTLNSWTITPTYETIQKALNSEIQEINWFDIVCSKQEHANRMFAVFRLLNEDCKALQSQKILQLIGYLQEEWLQALQACLKWQIVDKKQSNEQDVHIAKAASLSSASANAMEDDNTNIMEAESDWEAEDRIEAEQNEELHQMWQTKRKDHRKLVDWLSGRISTSSSPWLLNQFNDYTITCMINLDYALRMTLVDSTTNRLPLSSSSLTANQVFQQVGGKLSNQTQETIHAYEAQDTQAMSDKEDLQHILQVCLLDLQHSYIQHQQVMTAYHEVTNIQSVKSSTSKPPETVKLLPSCMSLLQYQLIHSEVNHTIDVLMTKCKIEWQLPMTLNKVNLPLHYTNTTSTTVRECVPANPFLHSPSCQLILHIPVLSNQQKSKPTQQLPLPVGGMQVQQPPSERSAFILACKPSSTGFCKVILHSEDDYEYASDNEMIAVQTQSALYPILQLCLVHHLALVRFEQLDMWIYQQLEAKEERLRKQQRRQQATNTTTNTNLIVPYFFRRSALRGDMEIVNNTTGQAVVIGQPCILKKTSDAVALIVYYFAFEFEHVIEKNLIEQWLQISELSNLFYTLSSSQEEEDIGTQYWDIEEEGVVENTEQKSVLIINLVAIV